MYKENEYDLSKKWEHNLDSDIVGELRLAVAKMRETTLPKSRRELNAPKKYI